MLAWTRMGAVEMGRTLDSGCVLKGEPIGIANGLDLGCRRKPRRTLRPGT